jgi:hypothetical protein
VDDDRAQIAEVLIRYATGIDQKDWGLLRTCWTDQIDVEYGQLGNFTSADVLTDVMARVHNDMGPTYHRMTNLVIAIDEDGSGDRATARSYVHAVLMLTPGDSENWIDVVGHYDDVFVRTPAGWRISRRVSHTTRQMAAGEMATALNSAAAGEPS